jgi:hypothetical protein
LQFEFGKSLKKNIWIEIFAFRKLDNCLKIGGWKDFNEKIKSPDFRQKNLGF